MKSLYRSIPIIFMGLYLLGCVGCQNNRQNENQIKEITRQRDSIAKVATTLNHEHLELVSYIEGIEKAIDSVAQEENILIIGKGEDGRSLTQKEIRERVKAFGDLLQRQRSYIKGLEDSLSNKSGSTSHLLSIVSSLRTQLETKESELNNLRLALRNEKATTAQMREIIGTMDKASKQMASENNQLTKALATQNEAINIGYKLIASKSDLEKMGILANGGFLKKKKLDYNAFKEDKFESIDIRYYEAQVIKAKKVKLITSAPANSYTLKKIGKDEWEFRIISPADFWSISNYMILQTN